MRIRRQASHREEANGEYMLLEMFSHTHKLSARRREQRSIFSLCVKASGSVDDVTESSTGKRQIRAIDFWFSYVMLPGVFLLRTSCPAGRKKETSRRRIEVISVYAVLCQSCLILTGERNCRKLVCICRKKSKVLEWMCGCN